MTAEDDKALSWNGDSDPNDLGSPWQKRSKTARKPDTPPVAAKAAARLSAPAPSSALLITYGILAGAYLLYTVGWLVTVFNDNRKPFDDVLTEVMYQAGEYLAIASPALWFFTALLLTRGRRPIVRLLALLLGLVVVIPWPFVLLGA